MQFTNLVHFGTNLNWLDFEVKRSEVKVMTRLNRPVVKKDGRIHIDCSPSSSV